LHSFFVGMEDGRDRGRERRHGQSEEGGGEDKGRGEGSMKRRQEEIFFCHAITVVQLGAYKVFKLTHGKYATILGRM